MTKNETIEKQIEKIFLNNGHTLTNKMKQWYTEWPEGVVGEKIKKEVNELIQENKSDSIDKIYRNSTNIGTIEINGQEVGVNLNIIISDQISTVNDKYFSLYTTSYENTDKHIFNPTFFSLKGETDPIVYRNDSCALVDTFWVTREEIDEAYEHLISEGLDTVKFYGENMTKEKLEQLFLDCENKDIGYDWEEKETYSLPELAELVREYKITLSTLFNRGEIIGLIDFLSPWSSNGKNMTKEQEEFTLKYKDAISKQRKEDTGNIDYYETLKNMILKHDEKVNNKEKIGTNMLGVNMVKEISPEDRQKIIKMYESVSSKNDKKEQSEKSNFPKL